MKNFDRLMEEYKPHIEAFLIFLEKFSDSYKDALENMAKHEWYPDNTGMPLEDILKISNDMKTDYQSCNILLIDHFKNRIYDLERELIDSNPNRQHIISEGFSNHREGRYNSSIPIFLSQADGIFAKSSNASLFISRARETVSKDHRLDEIIRYLFSINTLPIWINEKERSPSFAGFNRHQVLHGETVSYGTEENSLKAISFLSFINALSEDFPPSSKASSTMP